MKQIKIVLVKPESDTQGRPELGELRQLIEDNWIIVDKSVLERSVIYIMAKVPEEILRQIQEKKTLSDLLKPK